MLLQNIRERFRVVLEPACDNFNPIPAASCLLDPTVATVLLQPGSEALLRSAKQYVIGLLSPTAVSSSATSVPQATASTSTKSGLERFKFLTRQIESTESVLNVIDSPSSEVAKYINHIQSLSGISDSLEFWKHQKHVYPSLSALGEDLVAAPASEAFVERIFSAAGMLSTGRRNRMRKSLEMRVFLKLNRKFIS